MLEISLSCSLSDKILLHRVSTIVSTWNSFTLFTSGPRLEMKKKDAFVSMDIAPITAMKICTVSFQRLPFLESLKYQRKEWDHNSSAPKQIILLSYHLTAKFCTSPFLSSSNFRSIFTTCKKTARLHFLSRAKTGQLSSY